MAVSTWRAKARTWELAEGALLREYSLESTARLTGLHWAQPARKLPSTVPCRNLAGAGFAAGNCIHLAIGATVPATFHAWVDIAPTAISFSPSNQSGLSQPFTWTVSSPSGTGNLSHVFAWFHTTSSTTANACHIHYDPVSNLLYLANHASDNWLGGFAPGSGGSASNSQCSISGTGASVSSAGTQLTVQVTVTFQSSFSGTRNEYLYALDGSGVTSGWQQMGTWTVPAAPAPDFTFTAVNDSYYVQTGVYSYPAYTLAITPQNGFNSRVSLQYVVAEVWLRVSFLQPGPGYRPTLDNHGLHAVLP